MRRSLIPTPMRLALVSVVWCVSCAAGEAADLVRGGRAVLPICTGRSPSPTVQLAAQELQTYLRKMSGADVPCIEKAAGRPAILLGAAAAAQAGANVDLSKLGPEGGLLKTRPDGGIVVAGRTDLGTLNAAYDLLHLLGVRWFMPGDAGEYVPHMKTISVPALDRAFEPSFAFRLIWAATGRLPKPQRQEYADWQRRNHMPGAMSGSTGHAYDRIVSRRDKKLFAEKPYLFAEVKGKRTNRGQICTTHPEVIARAIAYARRYFAKRPDAVMVSLSPNDGAGFCRCPRCRAEGSPSDNALMLANRVGEALEKTLPDKMVAFYAYAGTSPPPTRTGRRNVIVWIATRFISPGYTLQQLIEGWSAKVHHIGIRDYYSVTPWSWQTPRYYPDRLSEDLRYYHEHKAKGVSAESEANFGSRGANYYAAARLMYDLSQPLDAVLDDYYAKCWGAAAPAMRRYWARWAGAAPVTTDRLALSLRDLQRAGQLAQTDPVRKRVRMMKAYLHYMRLFREYGRAPKAQRLDALGRAMRYGFRIEPLHAVAIKNVFYRIVGKPRARKIKVPETTLAQWRRVPPITDEEIDADFARDLADLKPLGVERKTFSDDLAQLGVRGRGGVSRVAYRGKNEIIVQAPADGAIRLAATTGLVRPRPTVLVLETMDSKEVVRVELPPGLVQKAAVDTGRDKPDHLTLDGKGEPTVLCAPGPGLYRLRVLPQSGSACRLDFGKLPHAIQATEARPLVFIAGTRGPLHFFVPRGTAAFGIGMRTPDHHGQLTVYDPEGAVVLKQAGDYTLGEEFRVDVPPGKDAAVWSLAVARCEDCTLYLVGVPGLLAPRGDTLLAPREAAR